MAWSCRRRTAATAGATIRLFADVLCLELVREGDSLATGSGRAGPAAVTAHVIGDSVALVDVRVPRDGATDAAALRRIFPHAIAQQLLRPTPAALAPRRAMERVLRDQAAARLGTQR